MALTRFGGKFLCLVSVGAGMVLTAGSGFAGSSTDIVLAEVAPKVYRSDINVRDCTAPIKSSPYVIIAGNGGANMQLSCPDHHPVMYSWHQQMGFGGWPFVSSGGGSSDISCCAVVHHWVDASA